MKKVVIGSHNPVKVAVVKEAFAKVFPDMECDFVMHKAPSGVSDQPFGIQETRTGAQNRAASCAAAFPDADYCVGLEGGIEIIEDEYWVSAWMCVQDKAGRCGFGRTSAFLLPPPVTALIKEGVELSLAGDKIFNETNSGQKGGAVSFLTNNLISRKEFYLDAMVFALVPFLKNDLYV
jgi:inosine/xanthosine triphosphatase